MNNRNDRKLVLREGGISKRHGWPYLLDVGMHVEAVFGEFTDETDKHIDSCRDLLAFKKKIFPKMLKEGNVPAVLSKILAYQTLHHVIYTEFVINFTNATQDQKSFEDVITSSYYSLMEASETTGGFFSIVPELDTSVEETVFLRALDYACEILEKGWIKGASLIRRGESSITSYAKRLSESGLLFVLDFTSKIEKSRFLDEIHMDGVRRIHYNARLEDILGDLSKNKIAVQISPASDLAFFSNFSLVDYPFIEYFRNGYKTVVSSGYPELTDSSIENEIVLLKSSFGLSVEEITSISKQTANYAFCGKAARESILKKLSEIS